MAARDSGVITLGRVYQTRAAQAPPAITEWASFPFALELGPEVSLNQFSFIEEYFMLTTILLLEFGKARY
jgi:hypothetical protein